MKYKSFTEQKDDLDRFYTNPKIAEQLVFRSRRILNNYNYFIEPSAGSGSFVDAVKNILSKPCDGFDLEPAREDIHKQNWFHREELIPEGVCIIGNPPFGLRSKLAKDFIQHSIKLNCNCIAFILPATFDKPSLQANIPEEYKLVYRCDLPKNSFLFNDAPYHVECVWQVWERNSQRDCNRWVHLYNADALDFEIVSESDDPDYFVMGAAPSTVKLPHEVQASNRGYWIKCLEQKGMVKELLQAIDWGKYGKSGVSGGVFWLTKQELIAYYNREIYGN